VEVVREDGQGRATVVAHLKEGDCFGEMALINAAPRNSTARSVKGLDVMTLRRSTFEDLFNHIPALRESFERLVAERGASAPPVQSVQE
jgi:CRP-like cAMP-binding protein